jgi:hypothetical protein
MLARIAHAGHVKCREPPSEPCGCLSAKREGGREFVRAGRALFFLLLPARGCESRCEEKTAALWTCDSMLTDIEPRTLFGIQSRRWRTSARSSSDVGLAPCRTLSHALSGASVSRRASHSSRSKQQFRDGCLPCTHTSLTRAQPVGRESKRRRPDSRARRLVLMQQPWPRLHDYSPTGSRCGAAGFTLPRERGIDDFGGGGVGRGGLAVT